MASAVNSRATWRAAAVLAGALLGTLAPAAPAQTQRPFAVRFTATTRGDIEMIGNTVLTCPLAAPNCAAGRAGSGPGVDNNTYGGANAMTYVDVDADPTTFNSSSATLTLPPGATVAWAGLYWGGNYIPPAGDGAPPPDSTLRGQVRFSTPAAGYTVVVASQLDNLPITTGVPRRYFQGFADVTAMVQAGGGGSYTVADLQTATGGNRHGGWALVVVLSDPAALRRNLTVFDGFALVGSATPVTVTASGFVSPASGAFTTRFGIVAWEGDLGQTGDQLTINGTPVTDAVNPAGNTFNSTVSRLGAHITDKTPNDVNQFGVDIDYLDVTGALANSATSAQLGFVSAGDDYLPGVATFAVEQAQEADVEVTKSGPAAVVAGTAFTYTLTVRNLGPGPAGGVALIDTLPAGAVFVSATGGGTHAGGVVTWPAIAVLANGASQSETVTVIAPPSGTLLNIAAALPITPDPVPGNNDGSDPGSRVTTTVIESADVVASKTGPSTAFSGSPVSYTVTVRNDGPSAAANVVVSDTLPPGLTFTSASGGGVHASGVVTWPAIPSLPAGSSQSFTMSGIVPLTGTLLNVVASTSSTGDPDPTNNDGSAPPARVTTVITEAADLAVTKSGPTAVTAGGALTYGVTVHNQGPLPALNLVVSDTLPPGLTGVTVSHGGTVNGNAVTWPLVASLAAGASQTYTISATAPAAGTLVNLAAATSTTADPDPANNNGSALASRVTTVVSPLPAADVAVTKTGPAAVAAGGTITYAITVQNLGPIVATGVVVTDTLPSTASFVSASGSGTVAGNVVTWPTIPTIGAGASQSFTVVVTAPSSGVLTNLAAATATTPDPDLSNNNGSASTARVVTTVTTSADVRVAKSGPATALVGSTFSYTVVVSNHGPLAAASVVVTDTLPAGVTFVSASAGGTRTGNVVTWPSVASLASGASLTFSVTVSAPILGTFTNLAAATSATPDPDPANNNGSAAGSRVTTQVVAVADVAVTKTGPTTANLGSLVTYAITVRNHGPGTASGVVVTDTLPVGLTFVGASGGATATGGVVRWPAILSLPSGMVQTFSLTARVDGAGLLTNLAAAASLSSDPDPSNNNGSAATSRVTTVVAALADVVAVKTGPASVDAGAPVSYQITVSNSGPNPALDVVVTDTLPTAATWVSATGGGSLAGGVVTWPAIPSLAPGASVTFGVTVTAPAAGAITNVVAARAASPDPEPGNNNGSRPEGRVITTIRAPDLAIAKSHAGDLAIGTSARYTLTVTNVGAVPTVGPAVVTDTLPAVFAVQAAGGAGWTCLVSGRVVTCSHPATLGPASVTAVELDVLVLSTASGSVVNRAYVSTAGDQGFTGNNVAVDVATVSALSPLVLEKRALREEVEAGDLVEYELVLSNVGAGAIAGVVVTDTLPAGFAYLPGSLRRDRVPLADPLAAPGPVLRIEVGTLGANSSTALRYRLRVGPAGPTGRGENRAVARSVPTGVESPLAIARVRFRGGLLSDRAFILGKVAVRHDTAGRIRELGVPGVRVLLSDGTSAVTDEDGRFSFHGLPPRLHVLRVDQATLPTGLQLSATGSRQAGVALSRFVDLTRGELHRADFIARGPVSPETRAAIAARAASPVGADVPGVPIEPGRAVTGNPGATGVARDRGDGTELAGVYLPLTDPLATPVAERHGLTGRELVAGRRSPGHGPRIEIGVPAATVPADGRTVVAVRVTVRGPDGVRPHGPVPVTLEASHGRWAAVDRDPLEAGVQVLLPEGEGTFGLVAPDDDRLVEIAVSAGGTVQTAVIAFVPAPRPMIAAGLVQARIDLRTLARGALVATTPDDGFDEELRDLATSQGDGLERAAARSALYLQGKIRGDYLLTLAYDTERDPERQLFRDIRPEEFYPVYGDASRRDYGARSAERLYVRVDQRRNFFLYGDYATAPPSEARELGAYLRTLTGAVQHLEQEHWQLEVFASRSRNRQVVEELAGRGVSGPYALGRRDLLANSERIELLTRDRNQPSRILRIEPLRRFLDYSLEPFTGRILFRRPVPSVDGDLNPVSIRVAYERADGGDASWIYGGDLRVLAGRRVELGAAVVQEEDPFDSFQVASANAALRVAPGTTIFGEWARTDGNAREPGAAARLEFRHQSHRAEVHAFALVSDTTFANPSSTLGGGRRELGGRLSLGLTGRTRLVGHVLRSDDRRTDRVQEGALVGVEQGFGRDVRLEAGYRYGRGEAGAADSAPTRIHAVHGRLAVDLGDSVAAGLRRASLFAEYDQDVHDPERRRGALGGQVQVRPRIRAYARHEFLSSFAGPFAPQSDHRSDATVFGFDAGHGDDGQAFSEYRLRGGLAGRDGEAVIGLRNRWLVAPGIRLDASFERITPTRGGASGTQEATAVTGGLEFTTDPLGRGTARIEYRNAADADVWLATVGYARTLSRDWTLLGRVLWNDLDFDQVRARGQVGLAWRQTTRGTWNAIARAERYFERLGSGSDRTRRAVTLASAHANVRPAGGVTLNGRWASKWSADSLDGSPLASRADLAMVRLVQDVGRWADVGIQASALRVGGFPGQRFGIGGEAGLRLQTGLRMAIGYNVFGFRDRDLRETEYTLKGFYLRLDYLLDEGIFRRDERP